ncbi:MAG: hypothetical protein HYV60_05925 [Planctomycetia bacterium]|nr:hypothetical protein [Planctomycetia bacterium]
MRNICLQFALVAIIVLGSMGTGSWALGQGRTDGNTLPPTFSPYMELFRDDTLSMPAYYQYLRPELERRDLYDRVETRIRALEGPATGRQTLRLAAPSGEEGGTSRSLRLRATTTTTTTPRRSAVRMDLMHYYPSATTPRARR